MSDAVLLAILAFLTLLAGTTLPMIVKVWLDLRTTKEHINSRMDELLVSVRKEERAAGRKEGMAEEKASTAEKVLAAELVRSVMPEPSNRPTPPVPPDTRSR